MERVDPDQLAADLLARETCQPQALGYDLEGEPSSGHRAGAAVADLALADPAVHVTDRDLEGLRTGLAAAARDLDPVRAALCKTNAGKIRHDVGGM